MAFLLKGEILKRVNVNDLPCARFLVIAAATATISACGGGSGGGGFPALPIPTEQAAAPAAPPATVSENSGPCFNEADFREGTLLEFDAAKLGTDPATASFHRKSVTEGRETFGGANPIAFNVDSKTFDYSYVQNTITEKEYKDLVGGNIMLYGKATVSKTKYDPKVIPPGFPKEQTISDSQVFSPPVSFPMDMKPGQVVSQRTSVAKTRVINGVSGSTSSVPANAELIYHGRESLKTPLGTFNVCKISLKITLGASGITKDSTKEFWLASEGPYRGQLLKGIDPKSPMVVTKMTYTPK